MKIEFIKSSQKKKILAQLNEQFGIQTFPHLLIESGKEKIRGYTGSLSKDEILSLAEVANIESIGFYMLKSEKTSRYRLSMDACQTLSESITKNTLEITQEDLEKWLRGYDLEIKAPKGIMIITYNSDFISCGISTGEIIYNHIPKDRRLKIPISKKKEN